MSLYDLSMELLINILMRIQNREGLSCLLFCFSDVRQFLKEHPKVKEQLRYSLYFKVESDVVIDIIALVQGSDRLNVGPIRGFCSNIRLDSIVRLNSYADFWNDNQDVRGFNTKEKAKLTVYRDNMGAVYKEIIRRYNIPNVIKIIEKDRTEQIYQIDGKIMILRFCGGKIHGKCELLSKTFRMVEYYNKGGFLESKRDNARVTRGVVNGVQKEGFCNTELWKYNVFKSYCSRKAKIKGKCSQHFKAWKNITTTIKWEHCGHIDGFMRCFKKRVNGNFCRLHSK